MRQAGGELLGPDLAVWDKPALRSYVIESILAPSKTLREGYRTVVVVTNAGQQFSGILVAEDGENVVLRDVSGEGREIRVAKQDLAQLSYPTQSVMPEGLVNQLADVGQFLDLVHYVIEVAEGGPGRGRIATARVVD